MDAELVQLREMLELERSTNALLTAELKEARAIIAMLKEQQQGSPRAAQRLADKKQQVWEKSVETKAQKIKLGI